MLVHRVVVRAASLLFRDQPRALYRRYNAAALPPGVVGTSPATFVLLSCRNDLWIWRGALRGRFRMLAPRESQSRLQPPWLDVQTLERHAMLGPDRDRRPIDSAPADRRIATDNSRVRWRQSAVRVSRDGNSDENLTKNQA
jgi:hypothetical protein